MKFRIAAVCSLLWLLFVIAQVEIQYDLVGFVILGVSPLVVGWGIWWIIKARKKEQ